MNLSDFTHLTLEDVTHSFSQWRSNRTKRGKIPSELMDQACSLVGRYPPTKIRSSLRISHAQFRQEAIKRGVLTDNSTPPAFVEVASNPPSVKPYQAPIVMEVMRHDGAKLSIQVEQSSVAGSLMSQFLEGK